MCAAVSRGSPAPSWSTSAPPFSRTLSTSGRNRRSSAARFGSLHSRRIEELTAEATPTLRLECSDPARATVLLQLRSDVDNVREEDGALLLHLVPGDPRATAAHIARVLLDAGFELYRLHPEHESLERRFLDITTRLGEAA